MNLRQAANVRTDNAADDRLAIEKFAVGQSVPRREDPMLVRGLGHYTDDASLPGQAFGVMVRSRNAHGNIRAIDIEAARKMPGVLGVYTGADLKDYG
ncbi:MAG: xanthine dehydrogenase family protein molybdopterin-binding subunit, partial [Xanthobacteraceae bacterium]